MSISQKVNIKPLSPPTKNTSELHNALALDMENSMHWAIWAMPIAQLVSILSLWSITATSFQSQR